MKKLLALLLSCALLLALAACGGDPTPTDSPDGGESQSPAVSTPVESGGEDPDGEETGSAAAPDPSAPVTDLYYSSEVTALEGNWTLSQVYVGDTAYDAAADALTFAITFSLDPSELVDDAAYIHNQVYNLTGELTFGVAAINDALSAEGLEGYRGSTSWEDFPQGEVVSEGEFYKQPGPATMRFQDMDVCGLMLDQLASGAPADVDTTERTLILGMNNHGQLLLGASEEHLERPGTSGEWTYCLIFDKAA